VATRAINKLKKKSPDSDAMLAKMRERISFVTFSSEADNSNLYGYAGSLASESGSLAGRRFPYAKGKKKKTAEAEK
jgi:hypothetical protein